MRRLLALCLLLFGPAFDQDVVVLRRFPATASTLNQNLVAYWKFDETSGTRVDSQGNNDLADNNTVTSAAGKIGNAALLAAANSESLTIADNADLSVGDIDFSIALWVRLTSKPANHMEIYAKWTGDGPYRLFWNVDEDDFCFQVGNVTMAEVFAGIGTVATGTWYLVVAWHDAGANTLNIQVDGGTVNSAAHSAGSFDDTGELALGKFANDTFWFWDGLIDEGGFWKKVLSASERSELYNGGAGKTCCPF